MASALAVLIASVLALLALFVASVAAVLIAAFLAVFIFPSTALICVVCVDIVLSVEETLCVIPLRLDSIDAALSETVLTSALVALSPSCVSIVLVLVVRLDTFKAILSVSIFISDLAFDILVSVVVITSAIAWSTSSGEGVQSVGLLPFSSLTSFIFSEV